MEIKRDGKTYELTEEELRKAFLEKQHQYDLEDAKTHCDKYVENHKEKSIIFSEADYEKIVEEFNDGADSQTTSDYQAYEIIVSYYAHEHFGLIGERIW